MRLYGLIGKKIDHSFSAVYFEKKFADEGIDDAQYRLFPLNEIADLHDLLIQHPSIKGLNVTIPYKKQVLHLADEVDAAAQEIGAANTLKIDWKEGRPFIKAFNTDYLGFLKGLESTDKELPRKALILGTGGAARAVAYALAQKGITYNYVSRTPEGPETMGYANLDLSIMSAYKLIINATPVGMFPLIDALPSLPYHLIGPNHFLCDLVYNPTHTAFLKHGEKQNAYICNGLKMLYAQADLSWTIWNDAKI